MKARLLVASFVLGSAFAWALPVETLVDSGATKNRINLVIVGDGYRTEDQQKLTDDAKRVTDSLFAVAPFSEFRGLFNVKLIKAESKDNGADRGNFGAVRDTRYGAYYFCSNIERLICADGPAVFKDVQENVPEYDYVVMLVNDTRYGGSGGNYVILSTEKFAVDILKHELGHLIGRLADEYETPYPGFPACSQANDCREPNVTIRNTLATLKWSAWVEPGTPIPTAETPASKSIGLFEGARYLTSGVYRPVNSNCRMRLLKESFCSVCTEGLVTSFLANVNLIDSVTPAPGPISLCDQPAAFSATPLDLPSGTLSTRWLVNGEVKATDQKFFQMERADLGTDGGMVELQATYQTAFVRKDSSVLRQSFKWPVLSLARCDAGVEDAGVLVDAGLTAPDAGGPVDAGRQRDAGSLLQPDSGQGEGVEDAGPQVDAGETFDASVAQTEPMQPRATESSKGTCGCQLNGQLSVWTVALLAVRIRKARKRPNHFAGARM
jgi:IgA Peptidase M64